MRRTLSWFDRYTGVSLEPWELLAGSSTDVSEIRQHSKLYLIQERRQSAFRKSHEVNGLVCVDNGALYPTSSRCLAFRGSTDPALDSSKPSVQFFDSQFSHSRPRTASRDIVQTLRHDGLLNSRVNV